MKLHLNPSSNQHSFTAIDKDWSEISGKRYTTSVVVRPTRVIEDWTPSTFEQLSMKDFDDLLALLDGDIQILLFGTGQTQKFLHPSVYQSLIKQQIGIEFMTDRAVARTFNILVGEDRKVACALLSKV